MRAGDFRHAVDVEQLSGSSADGMGNTYRAWAALDSGVMAEVRPLSQQERWNADKTQSLRTHQIRMRWLDGITSAMRIKFGSRYFTIAGILNTDERNIELVIDAVEVA